MNDNQKIRNELERQGWNILKPYELPYGWAISFPEKWVFEKEAYPEGDQYIFYPEESDLTVRATSFRAENDTGYAPVEVLQESVVYSCKKSGLKKRKDKVAAGAYITECYEGTRKENGKKIHEISVAVMVSGHLLKINIFASNHSHAVQALVYVNTVHRL